MSTSLFRAAIKHLCMCILFQTSILTIRVDKGYYLKTKLILFVFRLSFDIVLISKRRSNQLVCFSTSRTKASKLSSSIQYSELEFSTISMNDFNLYEQPYISTSIVTQVHSRPREQFIYKIHCLRRLKIWQAYDIIPRSITIFLQSFMFT